MNTDQAGGEAVRPSLVVTVSIDGTPAFYLDNDGSLFAPETAEGRSGVVLALSQAVATVAALPEPEDWLSRISGMADDLAAIGGPAAEAAMAGIRNAMDAQTAAVKAATAVIAGAIMTEPGTH